MLKLTFVNASLSCICKFPSLITKDVSYMFMQDYESDE